MEKLKMHSPNLTNANIERIKELFPNCVSEAKDENGNLKLAVDFDQLRQELSDSIVEGPQERYHLNWPGKREALLTANAPIAKTLRPAIDESVDFENTKNLFIEGDNLEALKLLQETYLGKVKMIYIDPPYNTGKDFIYEDDFAESTEEFFLKSNQKDGAGNRLVANTESNGRFHSDWLSFIYPRLKLARNLLSDDGVIFISIDDNEQANLKRLCDEVFGEGNFVANIINITGASQNGAEVIMQKNKEYCLCFAKNISEITIKKITPAKNDLRRLDDAPTPLITRKDMGYTIYYNPETKDIIPNKDYNKDHIHTNDFTLIYMDDENLIKSGYLPIRPPLKNNMVHRWRWGYETFLERKNEIIIKQNNKENYIVFFEQTGFLPPKDIINYGVGTGDVSKIFNGNKYFDYPKNIKLISYFSQIATNPHDIILDFFAGSSTTSHAVMQLNAEDGGNRKFIMVQIPEACDEKSEAFKAGYKNIAEISKERIRRAGKKILEGQTHEGWNKDVGFRVLKVDTSNMADVYYTPDGVKQNDLLAAVDNIKPDRTPEDLLFQVLLDWGVDLSLPITKQTIQGKTVFFVNEQEILGKKEIDLIACFDGGITEELVKEIAKTKPMRAVCKDNGFVSDSVKINAQQIFKQISPNTDIKAI